MKLRHEFVDYVPKKLDDGVLYVSIRFGTVVHRCACGCGEEVVTPLGPAEWKFTYDGRTVSLVPSVGNWSFRCRSHYWIDEGKVQWAPGFSETEVATVRQEARTRRAGYYGKSAESVQGASGKDPEGGFRSAIWKIIEVLRRPWGRGRE